MPFLNSVNNNLLVFGVAGPLGFVVFVAGKNRLNQSLSAVPTEYFQRSVRLALVLARVSIVVSRVLLLLLWNREIESGRVLLNNLARVVSFALSLYFVRNSLIAKSVSLGRDTSTHGWMGIHPLDRMFRHGIHAGIAAVAGLPVLVFIEAA